MNLNIGTDGNDDNLADIIQLVGQCLVTVGNALTCQALALEKDKKEQTQEQKEKQQQQEQQIIEQMQQQIKILKLLQKQIENRSF